MSLELSTRRRGFVGLLTIVFRFRVTGPGRPRRGDQQMREEAGADEDEPVEGGEVRVAGGLRDHCA